MCPFSTKIDLIRTQLLIIMRVGSDSRTKFGKLFEHFNCLLDISNKAIFVLEH